MNTKLITILATLAILTAGCNKPEDNSNQNAMNAVTAQNQAAARQATPPPIQAEPFHGQVYKTLDGRSVLTLVSKDECELAENGRTLLFKYTKQNDTLRMVTT